MRWPFLKTAAAILTNLMLATACSDKRAEAGLTGSDRVTAITWTGPVSLEPLFSSEVTIEPSGRAILSMQNSNGRLPTKVVQSPGGSFKSIAMDLADFRSVAGIIKISKCEGFTDSGPTTVSWHYASGRLGSYSVMPGCQQRHERSFLKTAASITRRVGLQSFVDRAPYP